MLFAWYVSPKAFSAEIWNESTDAPVEIDVTNLVAANWLLQAGIPLYPGDSILYAGIEIDPSFHLPAKQNQSLTYRSAYPVTLNSGGTQRVFYSSAPTLGAALWEQGIQLTASDVLSLPLNTPLIAPLEVSLNQAQDLTIQVGGQTLSIASAGATVGEALAQAGLALENLDTSVPADDQPLPADGVIKVVRVREETVLSQSPVAYSEVREADPDMEMGTEEIRQAGVNGVKITSQRVRYEDGVEVSRETESEWVSVQPVNQITAYGSKAVERISADTDCYVEYYLSKDVYVTSYHDTGQTTASGVWPTYGMIAVSPDWYSILKGSSICVPGYGVGTVTDVCPGCTGKDWIDVFIPTADYVSWSKNLTVYFMYPIPSGFTGDLP